VFVGWLAVVRAQCDNQTASSNTPPPPVRRASHQRVWPLYRAGRKQLLQANYGGVSHADVAVVCAVHFGAQTSSEASAVFLIAFNTRGKVLPSLKQKLQLACIGEELRHRGRRTRALHGLRVLPVSVSLLQLSQHRSEQPQGFGHALRKKTQHYNITRTGSITGHSCPYISGTGLRSSL
jgi:hypothetical protein